MCGRYTISRPAEMIDELENLFEEDLIVDFRLPDEAAREQLLETDGGAAHLRPRFNLAPTQVAPIVRHRAAPGGAARECAEFELTGLRWGLQPHWRRRKGRSAPLINARVETVCDKRSFAESMATRRCLVPADGFYEWSPRSRGHQPHLLTLEAGSAAGAPPFCFAGLWDAARDPSAVGCYTILTTAANAAVAPLHDRMPIVVPPSRWRHWLDLEQDADDALALLHSPEVTDAARWSTHPVGRGVNRVANDDPHLIDEVRPEPSNLSLF